ncbi:Fis family transcriptional regulator [Caballeronia fortuita]|uniref:Fis family transcriptional regulator n=1 Tax=Caballeronia fortuita TaxID=1777138 RepID=A0A158BCE9_9BURK|nr:Fis family transcriptional regulator [Caballeronia fortuita]SAK67729.1 Fis family transcriptional regulator [Caballeronia fortuita]
MQNAKIRRLPRTSRDRNARLYWLPMPRGEADKVILQCRIALESIRLQRAGLIEAQCIAQAVLLTGLLTEAGFGSLDAEILDDVEGNVLGLLNRGLTSGDWCLPEAVLPRLIVVINEHDRQLREVRLSAVIECNEHLERFIATLARSDKPPAR